MIFNMVAGGSDGKVQIQEGSVETPFLPINMFGDAYRFPVPFDDTATSHGNKGIARGESIYYFTRAGESKKLYKGEWGASDIPAVPSTYAFNEASYVGYRYFEEDDLLFAAAFNNNTDLTTILMYKFSTGAWTDVSASYPHKSGVIGGISVCKHDGAYHFFRSDTASVKHSKYNISTGAWTNLPAISHGMASETPVIDGMVSKNGLLYIICTRAQKCWSWNGTSYTELANISNYGHYVDVYSMYGNWAFASLIEQDRIVYQNAYQIFYSIASNEWTYTESLH